MSKYQGVNLYVKNLDESIDDAGLRQEFSTCGTITSAKVMRDDKGASKGFGFVCFSTPDEATKAVTEMNGKLIQNKPIYVALAQKKELRRQQLQQKHALRANGIRMQQQAQASGMTGSPLYAPGTPVFYAQPVRGVLPPGVGNPFIAFNQQAVQTQKTGYQGYRGGQSRGGGQRGGKSGRGKPNAGQQYPGIKYNPNVRNAQQASAKEDQVQQVAEPDRKQQLGEALYPMISTLLTTLQQPEAQAGKITGMVLELDQAELVNMLQNPQLLQSRVNEAIFVLSQAEDKKE